MITNGKAPKKKKQRSLFYRIAAWLHLWLGLITGAIMVVVCLCACIWVFNEEITGWLEPETKVTYRNEAVIPPSRLMTLANSLYPGKKVGYATYKQGNAIYLSLGEGRKGNTILRINPYTGQVISSKEHKEGETDFFRFILNGHRFLWLPHEIGRPIVNYSTLIFVVILISGIVLWWPRRWTKAARQQAFTIKTKASFKRVNYDLHNVLGFYSLIVLAIMALTGMVYGIKWYSNGLYWVTSGGESLPEFKAAGSDSLQAGKFYTPAAIMDKTWKEVAAAHPEAEGFYYNFADTAKPKSAINISVYPTASKYYNRYSYIFDQHTGQPIKGNNPVYDKNYDEVSGAAKLRRMNYDLHVGSILGLPGKILAFFGALIGASLPVTGFLVWWGKRKKKKKPLVQKATSTKLGGIKIIQQETTPL